MFRKALYAAALLGAGCLVAGNGLVASAEEELTGRQIMERVDEKNRADDEVVEARMLLIEGKALMKERELTFTVKTAEGYEDRTLTRFTAPGDLRGTGFLTHQHGKGEDDMWVYLPSLKKTKRLAATERKDPFFGSDYAYEDLRTENLLAYDYELLERTYVKPLDLDCWVIRATPATEGEKRGSGYAYRRLWISPDYLVRRVDYYEEGSDKPFKTQLMKNYHTERGWKGFERADTTVMIHHKKNTRTEFHYDPASREIDEGIDADELSTRALAQP